MNVAYDRTLVWTEYDEKYNLFSSLLFTKNKYWYIQQATSAYA